MAEIQAEIEIDASAERVWQVLTDFAGYREWNSVMQPVSGEAKAGARLKVRLQPWRGLGITFRSTVLKAEPGRELCWQGQLLLPSLFRGEHFFTIEPIGKGQVRFAQREVYTGLLVPLFMLVMAASTRRVFENMNRALKVRAEQAPGR